MANSSLEPTPGSARPRTLVEPLFGVNFPDLGHESPGNSACDELSIVVNKEQPRFSLIAPHTTRRRTITIRSIPCQLIAEKKSKHKGGRKSSILSRRLPIMLKKSIILEKSIIPVLA
jgi:hypothetical protein